jgi:integrase/recombinase XerD
MKQLLVQSENFQYIQHSFKQWLDVLGYAAPTVYNLPIMLREFFHYLESKNINKVEHITTEYIKQYYQHIKQRANTRTDGALSNAAINNQRRTLHLFMDYLRQTGRYEMPYIKIPSLKDRKEKLNTLTPEEIKQLFEATHIADHSSWDNELAIRDRALLSIFYGCGLRRNEARQLNLNDVNLDKATVHVKKGKGNKERLVPINKNNIKHLEDYVYNARPILLAGKGKNPLSFGEGRGEDAYFVSMRNQRINDQTMNLRLRILVQKTKNPILIEKAPSLHTLRHSIATHLLQNGMKIEHIAKFLGHSSLESTQLYTHLMEQEQ